MDGDLRHDAAHEAMSPRMSICALAALLVACTGTKSEAPLHGTIPVPARPTSSVHLSPGAAHTTVEGCLGAANEREAARFPVPPVTRGAPTRTVTVVPVAGGILVTHELAHACCLRSAITTRVERKRVVIAETLSGVPCRCMCSSTLRTSVGLGPGRWQVEVDLDRGRGAERIHEESVGVPPPK